MDGLTIWLDDIRDMPPGYQYHVHSLFELRNLLCATTAPIAIMSFDHDLGEHTADGYDIIKFLARYYLSRYPQIVQVHSANPVGAENIRQYDMAVRTHLLSGS